MKKISITFLIAGSFIFTSCGNDKDSVQSTKTNDSIVVTDTIVDSHNAKNSLDYEGIYEGILPCINSDCKEIELSLKLMPDNMFVYGTKRVGVDKEELMTTGTYHFEEDGNTIVLEQIANVPNSFFVSEGKIYQLDKNQKKIEGDDAEKYILLKK
ncbi:copper resistance protein NlpE [Faecalibacter macacae]|uniref:Copper resistance protein NlpE n=1 Tax=Faecalibacter macacae TaxID=1859289 RepID=A0A3L9MIF3_9FLAO|nr:copper resistance protein NlpE [Faecalibacter macacae]RLZ12621.1 copper resistance protein NlpE [Faecalibacter macacae]